MSGSEVIVYQTADGLSHVSALNRVVSAYIDLDDNGRVSALASTACNLGRRA